MQVEQDAFERAVELAAMLSTSTATTISDAQALGHMVWLWRWALSLPGELGVITGVSAMVRIEAGAHWTGPRGHLAAALCELGLLEDDSKAETSRVKGMDRYEEALRRQAADRERWQRANEKRRKGPEPHLTAESPRGDSEETRRKTQTQTQKEKEEPETLSRSGPLLLELVGEPPRKTRPPRKPPDPEAEFKRFAAALTPDEGAVFDAYEKHMDVQLGADWGLRKFVAGKLEAHRASELCAAIKGHAADPWKRQNSPSLKAILRDATVIATLAKAGAA